jgi:glycosyltransferase involved in cell wall biosynthesis
MNLPTAPPSVSIVILSHNYERYVGQALASAFGQQPGDYRLAEIVIIDDGSTDRSHDVYAKFPSVRVVSKVHEGFAATLSRAVQEASGDWLALLDADDSFTPDKLATLARWLADPDLLLVQHAECVIDAEGQPFVESTHPGGATSTLVVRTEAARNLLPITNELFFHVLADLGHGIRLSEPLARYRVHEASMTDRRTPGVFADYMAEVSEDVAACLDQLRARPPGWANPAQLAALANTYRNRATDYRADARRQRDRTVTDTVQKERFA